MPLDSINLLKQIEENLANPDAFVFERTHRLVEENLPLLRSVLGKYTPAPVVTATRDWGKRIEYPATRVELFAPCAEITTQEDADKYLGALVSYYIAAEALRGLRDTTDSREYYTEVVRRDITNYFITKTGRNSGPDSVITFFNLPT